MYIKIPPKVTVKTAIDTPNNINNAKKGFFSFQVPTRPKNEINIKNPPQDITINPA